MNDAVQNETFTYTCDVGNKLVSQSDGTNTFYFFYSNSNYAPDGFVLNGTDTYLYTKNLQGDVTGIADANGIIVTTYTYDAWGKILSVTGTQATTIGAANPIRYRGYYYDSETGLYYLQSRYYNPEWVRFINLDAYVDTERYGFGSNMFAYCENNPITNADYSGRKIIVELKDNKSLLALLKDLTNDKLALLSDKRTVYINEYAKAKNIKYLEGTFLIRELIKNQYTIYIYYITKDVSQTIPFYYKRTSAVAGAKYAYYNFEKNTRGSGSGSFVYKNKNIKYKDTPMYIVLGHELIHAHRAMFGLKIPNTMKTEKTYDIPLEEVYTIGIYSFIPKINLRLVGICTENDLRKEHGLRSRATYYLIEIK